MDNNEKMIVKKKGFSLLSFFLGILIGIIIILGGLFGVGYFALTYDLDRVLGMVGLDNGKDEEGRNKYVNTDSESGGVKNALELLKKIYSMSQDFKELTLGQIDDLVPATAGLVEKMRSSLEKYIDLDTEELKQVKFADFGGYFQNVVMEIRPADLIDAGDTNRLVQLLLYGVEADCVTVDGVPYPLYRDEEADVYFYNFDGDWIIAEKTGDGFVSTGNRFEAYNEETAEATGNYYIKDGEKEYIDPITIRSLTGTDGLGALGKMSVAELIEGSGDESSLINKILGDVSVDSLIEGNIDFDSKINSLEIGDLMDVNLEDDVMVFLAYGLSNLTPGEEGYTAIYKLGDDGEIPVTVTVEDGKITGIFNGDGEMLKGTTVGSISSLSEKIDISVFLDVNVDNKIIAYLAYGISDIQADEDGRYTAMRGEDSCTLEMDGNNIVSVIIDETGEKVPAANINQLSERVDGVTSDLKIRDIVDVSDNKILNKLGGYTIDSISDGVNELEITDIIDIDATSSILAYLAYGITKVNVEEQTAALDGEKVYLNVEENKITGVYPTEDRAEDEAISGTKINEINGRIDGLMQELTIGELLGEDISADNTVLNAVKNSTIKSLPGDIDDLTINELYANEIYGSAPEEGAPKKAVMKRVVESGASSDDEIDFNSSYLYYELVSGEFGSDSAVFKLVNPEGEKGKLSAYPADGKNYYTYGAASEFWQLLVTERKDTGSGDEHAYSLNGLTDMIDNIHNNMQYFTLDALQEAKILTFKNGELEKVIPNSVGGAYGGKTLGELTIPDAIEAMVNIMSFLSRGG